MVEKRILSFVESGSDLKVTHEKGATEAYRADPVRTLFFEAISLELWVAYASESTSRHWHSDFNSGTPAIGGRACLRGDKGICIIHEPTTETREFGLSIEPQSTEVEERHQEALANRDVKLDYQCNASLFFDRANKEYALPDTWSLGVRVPPDVFDALANAIRSRELLALAFSLKLLRGAYVDVAAAYGGHESRVYLCPRNPFGEAQVRCPESAHGVIKSWNLQLAKIDLLHSRSDKGPPDAAMQSKTSGLLRGSA